MNEMQTGNQGDYDETNYINPRNFEENDLENCQCESRNASKDNRIAKNFPLSDDYYEVSKSSYTDRCEEKYPPHKDICKKHPSHKDNCEKKGSPYMDSCKEKRPSCKDNYRKKCSTQGKYELIEYNHRSDSKYHKKPTKTILKCGTPGAVSLPVLTTAGTTFNVASVSVDSSKFCNPCIKFEFASNIVTTAAVLTLNFQIYKQCGNQLIPIPVGPIWTFSRIAEITSSDTFSFVVCDCDSCKHDCCTYSVIVTVAGVATVGITSINNATLSALAVENSCNC